MWTCCILKLPITAIYSHLCQIWFPIPNSPNKFHLPSTPTSSKFPGRPSASTSAASGPRPPGPPGRLGRPGPPPTAADPCPALGRLSAGSRRAATYHNKDGKWMETANKPGSTTIATPGYCLEHVLGLPSLQSSFLVFGKFVQPINALTYFPFPYAVSITPLPQQV